MNGDNTGGRAASLTFRVERVERIAALLGEIEELSHGSSEVPLPLLIQTLETLERARGALKTYAQRTMPAAVDTGDGDPQPEVDNDVLERMYRTIATGRRPPQR